VSNSAKQRSFIKDLIKHLEEIGLEVILEQSKNFILSIIYRDKKKKVAISCTPTDRASAQRAALADVKRTIAELDESIARAFNPQGLLQMMTNNSSSQNQNTRNEPMPDYESLRDSLTTSGLDKPTIDDIIKAVKAAIESNDQSNGKDNQSSSIGNGGLTPNGITVLTPDGNFPPQCSRIVTVYAREQKNRVRAYSLKKALEALIDYYSHCLPITKLGVVVTDVWRPSELFTFEPALDFYEAKGIPTIIILKSNANLHLLNFPWR
jgi:hypothetical protein